MTLNRYAKRRDENEPPIVKALRKAGVQVWYLDQPVDLLTAYQKEFRLLEVKDEKKNLTVEQAAFFEDTIGYPRFRIVTIEDALRVHGLI